MRHLHKSPGIALVALILLLGAGMFPSIAHEGATGVVAERMAAMESLGDSMKGLAAMYRGEAPYDSAAVRNAARTIGRHGGEHLTRLFPDGSIMGRSEALPAIWQDWDEFVRLADEMSARAESLADAASGTSDTSSATRRSFARLGRVCSNCHTEFREDD